MPNHDDFRSNFVAPPDWEGECNEWCAGMHLIERELTDHPDIELYDVADLMVMGGFGHSRLRQRIFGGTTTSTIRETRTPVLMAH